MSRLRRSNETEQTRRGERARAFRLLPGIYDAMPLHGWEQFLYTTHPALTRWAKVCRASGAPRSYIPRTQRLRAGLKYVAPSALERGRPDTARREGTGVPAAARNLRCRGWPILAGFAPTPHPAAVAG